VGNVYWSRNVYSPTAVYCLDNTRTETGPAAAGAGCLGDITHVTCVAPYVVTEHGSPDRLTSGAGDPSGGKPTPVM
jgi:hypothetical protein